MLLALIGLGTVVSSINQAGRIWRNPFGFATRVMPSGPTVLTQMQKLERLETYRYHGQAIVRGETSGHLPIVLAGDRILFIGHGEVVAGIDLSRMNPQDVRVDGETVTLHLPEPEIFHARLDNRQSEVHERTTGFFSRPDAALETKVRREAEDRIRQAAIEGGVLRKARENAEDVLRRQMKMLGFRDIKFR